MGLSVIVLAAGQGKRMHSDLPKVLHPIAGKPLLEHIVQSVLTLKPEQVIVVHGYEGALVKESLKHYKLDWVEQSEQLGTGHAVKCALPLLKEHNQVLILCGDVPLIGQDTLENLCQAVENEDEMALLVAQVDDPAGYGRIIRDSSKKVIAIVETKDAKPEQYRINEINAGVYLVPGQLLKRWLPALKNQNAQKEYYLTDIVKMAVSESIAIVTGEPSDVFEIQGVNDRLQLAELERIYQGQQAQALMEQGVTLADPNRFDLRGEVSVGKDVFIDVNVILEGKVSIGDRCTIGPNTVLKNVNLGEGVRIEAFSHIEEAVIADAAVIGPYARLRPGSDIRAGARVGNFVEVKKSVIGKHSKVNHLSYIGDAELGESVNIGAGTITCNYDGVNKFKTIIGDRVFIGSDSQLVAPVEIGADAFIGAGSTITKDAPAGQLTVSRAKQVTIAGWKKPEKKD